MKTRLLILLMVGCLVGCVTHYQTTPPAVVTPAPPMGDWPALGWGTNVPPLAPITNAPAR